MKSVYSEFENAKTMVQGAYKKLKSYLYYDKTLVFAKKRLAFFESDRNVFQKKLDEIAYNLSKENSEYFDALIKHVDFRVLPKKFSSCTVSSDVICSSIDHMQKISKVNFFIDMPIELYILDFLWTLLIGKIASSYLDIFKYSGATAFKKSLFTEQTDLINGVDYKSNRSFEPYFQLYKSWRNKAFEKIEELHSDTDSLLICLDLKSFYYSVEFDFNQINMYLKNDSRLHGFDFLTSIIKKIYYEYTDKISGYRKGIKNKFRTCVFPIGVISVLVLRELYLYNFDKEIVNNITPDYYKRYVDDILIVVSKDIAADFNRDDIISKYFINNGLIYKIGNNSELSFAKFTNIKIQKEKVNCFYFPKNEKNILFDIYSQAIEMNSSEANLLPDINVIDSSFTQSAYNIDNLQFSKKIREIGILKNNSYNATRFINSLLKIIKNTNIESEKISQCLDEIEEFYRGSQSIEYSNNWRSLFELYLISHKRERAKKLYDHIVEQIKKLDFEKLSDEVLVKNKGNVLKRLKKDLKEKLNISVALTAALDYSFFKINGPLAKYFRASNLLNHNMVSYPLLNYSTEEYKSLVEINLLKYNKMKTDSFKLTWTPRFINAIEFYISHFVYVLDNDKLEHDPNANIIYDKYIKYNDLKDYVTSNYIFKKEMYDDYIFKYEIEIKNKTCASPKIAIVNTPLTKEDVSDALMDQNNYLNTNLKAKVFKIFNIAKEENVNILVFPEFYFPIPWLLDVAIFSIKNNINVITGMQFISIGNKAYNTVCNIIPTITGKNFHTGFLLFREKNYYSPEEIIELSKLKLRLVDENNPRYYVIKNGSFSYSTMLCYEFTDISARAAMKSDIEMLFVPQFNRDTNYFSAIVESTARDLHCFVIQANTSIFGDSRITAPYKTLEKNILQVKGGETDVIMISSLDINELIKERIQYPNSLKNVSEKCFNCKRKKRFCEKCANKLKKGKVKGVPPHF